MTSKFKVGDDVYLKVTVEEVDEGDPALPYLFDGVGWVSSRITIIPASDLTHVSVAAPMLDEMLTERTKENDSLRARITKAEDTLVTKYAECAEGRLIADTLRKERDDAREQLARVCAQVETLAKQRDEAVRDRAALRNELALIEPSIAQYQASKRDARILDCVATLLAMRGES